MKSMPRRRSALDRAKHRCSPRPSPTTRPTLLVVGDALQRMRELAVQSRNATNSSSDKNSLDKEFKQLQSEITRVLGGASVPKAAPNQKKGRKA